LNRSSQRQEKGPKGVPPARGRATARGRPHPCVLLREITPRPTYPGRELRGRHRARLRAITDRATTGQRICRRHEEPAMSCVRASATGRTRRRPQREHEQRHRAASQPDAQKPSERRAARRETRRSRRRKRNAQRPRRAGGSSRFASGFPGGHGMIGPRAPVRAHEVAGSFHAPGNSAGTAKERIRAVRVDAVAVGATSRPPSARARGIVAREPAPVAADPGIREVGRAS